MQCSITPLRRLELHDPLDQLGRDRTTHVSHACARTVWGLGDLVQQEATGSPVDQVDDVVEPDREPVNSHGRSA